MDLSGKKLTSAELKELAAKEMQLINLGSLGQALVHAYVDFVDPQSAFNNNDLRLKDYSSHAAKEIGAFIAVVFLLTGKMVERGYSAPMTKEELDKEAESLLLMVQAHAALLVDAVNGERESPLG